MGVKIYDVPGYKKPEVEKPVRTESMELQHEFQNNLQKIKALRRRNREIKRLLSGQPIIKDGHYFTLTIQLYALRLEEGCWYIGQTRNPEKRFRTHVNGGKSGAMWTKKYKPIEIVEIRDTRLTKESEAARLEDQMTLEYARVYGIDKVRGGGYCQSYPHWPPEI